MYTEEIMQKFITAPNAGGMKDADAVGQAGNMKCGDIMKIFLKVDENNIITDAKFKTFGCVAAIVCTDTACDMVKGKSINDALEITNRQVIDMVGHVPKQKIHCSVMARQAIQAAVLDFKTKRGLDITDKDTAAIDMEEIASCSIDVTRQQFGNESSDND